MVTEHRLKTVGKYKCERCQCDRITEVMTEYEDGTYYVDLHCDECDHVMIDEEGGT